MSALRVAPHLRITVAVLVMFGCIAFPEAARAAAPRLIIFFGNPLERAVVLRDWDENGELLAALQRGRRVRPADIKQRPSVVFALFWSPSSLDQLRRGEPVEALLRGPSVQRGRFYPAFDVRKGAIELPLPGPRYRTVPPDALAILMRNGVPVRIGEKRAGSWRWWIAAAFAASIGGALAFIAVGARSRSRLSQRRASRVSASGDRTGHQGRTRGPQRPA